MWGGGGGEGGGGGGGHGPRGVDGPATKLITTNWLYFKFSFISEKLKFTGKWPSLSFPEMRALRYK